MKAKILIASAFSALTMSAFSQYTRNDNQNSNPYARAYQRVDAGSSYSIELRNGELWSCGINTTGQLGIGNTTNQVTPTQIGTDNNWQVFSTGFAHALAIKANGTLWGWGSNANGQLGDGTTTDRNAPVQIGTDNKWVMVSAGNLFTIGLKSNGTIWAWGYNANGQLGIGSTTSQNAPVQIGTSTDWKYITAGYAQTFGIKANGTLWSWGSDMYGALANGTTLTADVTSPAQIGSDTKWLKVSCKYYHSMAIKTTGELFGWGHNGSGQLGLGNTTNQFSPALVGSGYQNISVGEGISYAIKNGQFYSCGSNSNGQLGQGNTTNLSTFTVVGTSTNAVAVAASNSFGFLLSADGQLDATGRNTYGQLRTGNTTNTTSFTSATTALAGWLSTEISMFTAYGVKQNGTIWAWGGDFTGVPVQQGTDTDWLTIVRALSGPTAGQYYALKADGTLWFFDGTNFNLTSSQVFRSVYSNSIGGVYAITIDGNMWKFTNSTTGTVLSTSGDWVRAGGGGLGAGFVIGLKNDGTVWVSGTNYNGVYGNGTTATVTGFNSSSISNVIGITTCNFMPYALKADGTMMAWGNNVYGELRNGSAVTYSTTPVSLTNGTNVIKFDSDDEGLDYALKADGKLWHAGTAGGDGPTIQTVLTLHSTMTDVVYVAKGRLDGAVIKAQRDVICLTGNNSLGTLGDGTTTPNDYFGCSAVTALKPVKPTTTQATNQSFSPEENGMQLYPNPSTGLINVNSGDNSSISSITVMDLRGNIVYELASERISEVNLNYLPKGTYFVQLTSEKNQEMKKIVLM